MLLSRPSYLILFFLATTEEAAFNRLAFAGVGPGLSDRSKGGKRLFLLWPFGISILDYSQ